MSGVTPAGKAGGDHPTGEAGGEETPRWGAVQSSVRSARMPVVPAESAGEVRDGFARPGSRGS